MQIKSRLLLGFFILLLLQGQLFSQKYMYKNFAKFFAAPLGVEEKDPKHHRIHPLIPEDEAMVSALVKGSGDQFYGGTQGIRGRPAWLFSGHAKKRSVSEVLCLKDILSGQSIVSSILYESKSRTFYGSSRNLRKGKWLPEEEFIEVRKLSERDAPKKDIRPPAGHLFMFKNLKKIKDLGPVIEGEGIYHIVYHKKSKAIYGISDHFKIFKYDIKSKKTKILFDQIPDTTNWDGGRFYFYGYGEKLVVDKKGKIWGTGFEGQFFSIDTKKDEIKWEGVYLPTVRGREQMNGVQSWTMDKSGMIYGGTRMDGLVFSFDPKKKICRNLGKANTSVGMPGIAINKWGQLWMTAGNKNTNTHIIAYDTKKHFYIDLGVPYCKVMPMSGWNMFQMGNLIFIDNILVVAEHDRGGHIGFFIIDKKMPEQPGYKYSN